MRALLDLMRENEKAVRDQSAACQLILSGKTSTSLTILDQERGDEDLIKSVDAQLAKLRLWAADK